MMSSVRRRHPFPRNWWAKLDPQSRQLLIALQAIFSVYVVAGMIPPMYSSFPFHFNFFHSVKYGDYCRWHHLRVCRRLEHWCGVPASSIITPSSIFLFLFFILYRISGNVKVLRSLTDVQAHLRQHPDPRVDFSKFNFLEKYFQATPLHEALALEGKAADTAEPLVDDSLAKDVVQESIPDLLCGWGSIFTEGERISENHYLNLGRKMEIDVSNSDVGKVRKNFCCINVSHLLSSLPFQNAASEAASTNTITATHETIAATQAKFENWFNGRDSYSQSLIGKTYI
jgi:hypothetical protein